MIRASAPYTSGWGSFVLLKMDCVRVAWGGSLSTLHRFFSKDTAKTKLAILVFLCRGEFVRTDISGRLVHILAHVDHSDTVTNNPVFSILLQ